MARRGTFPSESRIAQKLAPDGTLAYLVHTTRSAARDLAHFSLHLNFGGVIRGDRLRRAARPALRRQNRCGGLLAHPAPAERGDYSEFVTLNDAWGMQWGQDGSFAYPPEQWAPGEVLAERVRVQTDDGTPPSTAYTLHLGWWSDSTRQRLTVLDAQGHFTGITIPIGPITVTRRIARLISTRSTSRIAWAGILTGLHFWVLISGRRRSARANGMGDTLLAGGSAPLPDRQVTFQLRSPISASTCWRAAARCTGPIPRRNGKRTSWWQTGSRCASRRTRRPAPAHSKCRWTIYRFSRLASLTCRLLLARGRRRSSAPDVGHAGYADCVVGYDVQSPISNLQSQKAECRLYWQSLREMDENYTVFVHLVDSNGGIVRGQEDNAPVNDSYPNVALAARRVCRR